MYFCSRPKHVYTCSRKHSELFSRSWVIFICSVVGCSFDTSGGVEEPALQRSSAQAALRVSFGSLAFGTRETLVDGITSAENLFFLSDGRLLVTSADAIYEVRPSSTGSYEAVVLQKPVGEGCQIFAGIAQVGNTVYVNCCDFSDSSLFAADVSVSPLSFSAIYTLPGVMIANGLAADDQGRLYVAESLGQRILRLHPSLNDPFVILSQESFIDGIGNVYPDGLKVFNSSLYWTDITTIKRAAILSSGRPGPVITLVNQPGFFDDLYVDSDGILVADFIFSGIQGFNLRGRSLDVTLPGTLLTNPTAVVPALGRLGLSSDDLIITENGANRVSVFHVWRLD